MIRLTLILLAGIFATLSVAGREAAVTGSGDDVAGTRSSTGRSTAAAERLALADERDAVARALSATDSYEAAGADAADRSALWRARAEAGFDEADLLEAGPVTPAQAAPGNADLARVNADRVNLRAGPSTANQVLDQVVRDQRLRVLEARADGWARISVPETGFEAWIFGRFLSPAG